MYLIKNFWFFFHKFYMYILPFCWIIHSYFLIGYFFIILSWKLNNNQCIITQLEYYLFHETFLGNKKKFTVPTYHRLILYLNFFAGLLYQSLVV